MEVIRGGFKFKVSLGYRERLRLIWVMYRNSFGYSVSIYNVLGVIYNIKKGKRRKGGKGGEGRGRRGGEGGGGGGFYSFKLFRF